MPKRSYSRPTTPSKRRKMTGAYVYKRKTRLRKPFRRQVRRLVNAMAETKVVLRTISNNVGVKHNYMTLLDPNLLKTDTGIDGETLNPAEVPGAQTGTRIGRKVYAKGLSIRFKLENFQNQPELNYRVVILRNKIGNSLTADEANIWEGSHDDRMIDYLDTDRWDVKFSKIYKLKMPGFGTGAATTQTGQGAGTAPVSQENGTSWIGRPKRFVKTYIPINKELVYPPVRSGSGYSVPYNEHWQMLIMCYSAFTAPTAHDSVALGFIDCTTKMYFKDL